MAFSNIIRYSVQLPGMWHILKLLKIVVAGWEGIIIKRNSIDSSLKVVLSSNKHSNFLSRYKKQEIAFNLKIQEILVNLAQTRNIGKLSSNFSSELKTQSNIYND